MTMFQKPAREETTEHDTPNYAEKTYHMLVELSLQGLIIFQDGRVVFANATVSSITGYSLEELRSFTPADVESRIYPEDRAMIFSHYQNRTAGKPSPSHYECRIIRKDDAVRWIEIAATTTHYHEKPAIQAAFLDTTERKLAEEALRESEERYRTLIETSPEAILLTGMDRTIRFCNQQAARLFGYASVGELYGLNCEALIVPGLHSSNPLVHVQQLIQTGKLRNIEYTMRRHDGSRFPAEVSSSVVTDKNGFFSSLILIVQDISERKQLQARIIESERFAASGRLATSVAHEINTPLQALQTSLEMIRLASDTERNMFLDYALDEIQRIGRIVHQLLDLYRPGAASLGPVELNSLLERLLLFIGKRIRDQHVMIETHLAPELPALLARADELMQVILNLLVNALEVMPEGGTLSITTRLHEVWQPESEESVGQNEARAQPAVPLQCIEVHIQDTGCGIAIDMQELIFEPFMTTKSCGTGLGLAISRQIVRQHGGSLFVKSQLDVGSTFMLRFPIPRHPYAE